MDTSAGPAWSEAVGEADWIGERLSRADPPTVTWVVPVGLRLTPPDEPNVPLPGPIPAAVRHGPKARVRDDDYPAVHRAGGGSHGSGGHDRPGEAPSLWWPADRSWCVASDQDLPWTYVDGPSGLIEQILGDNRIEALPAAPDDPLTRVEEWVATWAEEATATLFHKARR